MVAEVYAGLAGLKAAFDIAKGLKDISDATIRNTAVIELQAKILAAQEEQSALLQRVRDLEGEIKAFQQWEKEKQRYQLIELPPGVFVFELKPEMMQGEAPHKICQTCYQHGKKSILQQDEPTNGTHHLICNECETRLSVGYFRAQRRANTRPRSSWAV
jgi:hypothetical protein